jgi:hypothetical protein
MRIVFLAGLLLAVAACGNYRFPPPVNETGTVHGQVTASTCTGPCPASLVCPPPASRLPCGQQPVGGLGLVFTKGNITLVAKTDPVGDYSINLPVGTWSVTAATIAHIVKGPQTVDVEAGTSTVADFVVDTGMRAAA